MPCKKKEKRKIDWRIVCTGIAGLTGVEIVALLTGHNGILLNTYFIIIALATGIYIKRPEFLK